MKTIATALLAACLAAGCATQTKSGATPEQVPAAMDMTLSGDALFAFGKSGIDDLSADGRAQLDDFATRLQVRPYTLVRVVGHSDRIGGDKANMALSTKRAHAVRDYLLSRGVPDAKMVATGRGPYQPVAKCEGQSGQGLIDCLAPNRRVELTVDYVPGR